MKLARFFLGLFVGLVILNLSREVVKAYTGIDIKATFADGLFPFAVASLVIGAWRYETHLRHAQPLSRTPHLQGPLLLYGVAIVLMLLHGLAREHLMRIILIDFAGFAVIWLFALIGRHDRVWEDLEKPLIVLGAIGFAMVYLGLDFSYAQRFRFMPGSDVRLTTATYGYDSNEILSFWPLPFLLAFYRKKWDIWKLLGLSFFLGFLLFMIYFQKRAPTARALVFLGAAMCVTLLVGGFKSSSWQMVLAVGILVVVSGLMLTSATFSQSVTLLGKRYQEPDYNRIEEAKFMLSDLDHMEYLFGRGMGGYYSSLGASVVTDLGQEEVDYAGHYGRICLHTGILYPLLKGGLLFSLIYYSMALLVFVRAVSREWRSQLYNSFALTFLAVHVVFQLTEGPPTLGNIFEPMLVGLAFGRAGAIPKTAAAPVTEGGGPPEAAAYGAERAPAVPFPATARRFARRTG